MIQHPDITADVREQISRGVESGRVLCEIEAQTSPTEAMPFVLSWTHRYTQLLVLAMHARAMLEQGVDVTGPQCVEMVEDIISRLRDAMDEMQPGNHEERN